MLSLVFLFNIYSLYCLHVDHHRTGQNVWQERVHILYVKRATIIRVEDIPRSLTNAEVFIIESLKFVDEEKDRLEGKFLSHIMRLRGKSPEYYYIRTKKELKEVLKLFEQSAYRYLHLSCHGRATSISTMLDRISFRELGQLVKPYLRKKRLFISACSAVNIDLAKNIIPSSGCLSIIGPVTGIEFPDAAIIYASFYHLMFKRRASKMTRKDVASVLQKVADTFGISLNYFSISKKHGFKGDLITPRKKMTRIYPATKQKTRILQKSSGAR